MCISPCCAVGDTVSGCTGSSSLSGLVNGVLSVSCSSELLLSFSTPRSTFTPLLMRTTSSPLTHDQHTLCYWPTLYISCMLSVQYREITSVRVYNIYVRVCAGEGGGGRPEKGGRVMLHTDRSLHISYMITCRHAHTSTQFMSTS